VSSRGIVFGVKKDCQVLFFFEEEAMLELVCLGLFLALCFSSLWLIEVLDRMMKEKS